MKNKSLIKENNGSALAYVIIVLMIMSILALSIAQIFNANLKQTKYLQNNLEAYYLAYSGALIGYEALLADSNNRLDDLVNGISISPSTIDFSNGNATVSAEISTDVNFEDWIKITSEAILDMGGARYTRVMYFDPTDPLDVLWRNN